jgi:hypothetical protein
MAPRRQGQGRREYYFQFQDEEKGSKKDFG